MRRFTMIAVPLTLLSLLVCVILVGCTDLREGTEATDTTDTTLTLASESTVTQPTAAPAASTTVVSSTTTAAPVATTTTAGSTPSSILQFEPGLLQTEISAMKIDPNLLVTPTRHEDSHAYLHWEGTWSKQTDPAKYSGGSQKATHTENDYVEVFFKGTGVRLIASKSVQGAKVRIVLTGNGASKVETVSLYSATPLYQQTVWYSGHLTYGDYAVYFEHDATNSGFKVVWVDAIDIWGTTTPP